MTIHVFRDILDKQIVDKHDCKMGRVDGIVARVRPGSPPVIEAVEMGMSVVAHRIHPALGRWSESMSLRFGVRTAPRYRVEWARVKSVDDQEIRLMVDAESTPAYEWEWWLRSHIVQKIPGGKPDDEEK